MNYLNQLVEITSQVRKATEGNCEIEAIEVYATGYNSWLQYRPPMPRPIWEKAILEASILEGVSIFLVVHGFYEEACAILRGVLDGFLTRLYWDTQDKNGKLTEWEKNGIRTNDYCEWETGATKSYPTSKEIWDVLRTENNIERYDKRYQLKAEIDNLLSQLNKFVHGRPQTRHYPGASRSSLINARFKKKHFYEWFEYLKAIYRLISVLSILQYPKLLETKQGKDFEELEPEVAARIRNILEFLTDD